MDTNSRVAALLRDLAAIQTSPHSTLAYKRAAKAILALEEPLEALVRPDGTMRKIPLIGPSSARVIHEVLETGTSPTAERAVRASARWSDVERSRGLRDRFLSRAEVVAVLTNRRLRGPSLADYRGDLQMHSVWSDGAEPLDALVQACLARGYRYCAITDHSYGLPIASGMSMDDVIGQHREIDQINRRHAGRFRLIKGIEANIRADGSVDMTRDELRRFELIVAAPHSKLRISEDQTDRLLAAVRAPGVNILGHPRGRMYGSRPGVSADWDKIFAAAARADVAVEIDGDPWRQDVDFALARRAFRAGCVFALDSDAHSSAELGYAETAIAHARLARLPRERIVNCWEVERLLEWSARAWSRHRRTS